MADPYAEARSIHPRLFDDYGETGRYHLKRPYGDKPSKEVMDSASERLLEAREELQRLNEESREELSRAHLDSLHGKRRPFNEIYKKHNEYENEIIPEQEGKIRDIEQEYAWYRYEQSLQEFKDYVAKHSSKRRGGTKRRRKQSRR